MSTTVATILTAVAYRRRENSSPDNTNEQARRIRYIAEGQREILTEQTYWFTEKETSQATASDKPYYDIPSDHRQTIDLRVDNLRHQPRTQAQADNAFRSPPSVYLNSTNYYGDKFYYEYNGQFWIMPTPSSAPSAVSVSTLTSSGTTATCTTATNHGYTTGDYVVMAGANETTYNGTFKIIATGTTTFTYTLSTSTSSPATGTITATKNNIVIRYHYWPTDLSATTDTVIIPDPYISALIAYVWARMSLIDGERGNASDGFDEFNATVKKMKIENQRRNYGGKAISAEDFLI